MRFGVLDLPDAPFPDLVERWRHIERLGLDQLWIPDHSGDYRDPSGHWFDGWTTLAAAATATSAIRIGSLVSNPILRSPVLLAKEAVAVDHLSGGRLELGLGTGVAEFDHRAMGIAVRSPSERVDRYAEYVAVVDGVLRSRGDFSFDGSYYRTSRAPMAPPPVQRPRPPIVVGGQARKVVDVAARFADAWNTHGPFGHTAAEILELTRRQNATLDELCARYGRDPTTLRRSLLLYGPLDPWRAGGPALEGIVESFAGVGMQEFVVFWPPEDRLGELERLVSH